MKAIVIHPADNVATVLTAVRRGDKVMARCENEEVVVEALQSMDAGHKIALANIQPGAPVVKYGQRIGAASCSIRRGEHVHVHNVKGERCRGDLGHGPDL